MAVPPLLVRMGVVAATLPTPPTSPKAPEVIVLDDDSDDDGGGGGDSGGVPIAPAEDNMSVASATPDDDDEGDDDNEEDDDDDAFDFYSELAALGLTRRDDGVLECATSDPLDALDDLLEREWRRSGITTLSVVTIAPEPIWHSFSRSRYGMNQWSASTQPLTSTNPDEAEEAWWSMSGWGNYWEEQA